MLLSHDDSPDDAAQVELNQWLKHNVDQSLFIKPLASGVTQDIDGQIESNGKFWLYKVQENGVKWLTK